ncbi:hypothetical protein V9T40_000873 [Parthenolecanium corni]|uniref:Uncharacterized protein n=1 Tax=Parthenolecanium corni TaxID=536013 RepID=A0AAN9Y0U9_9HEMI
MSAKRQVYTLKKRNVEKIIFCLIRIISVKLSLSILSASSPSISFILVDGRLGERTIRRRSKFNGRPLQCYDDDDEDDDDDVTLHGGIKKPTPLLLLTFTQLRRQHPHLPPYSCLTFCVASAATNATTQAELDSTFPRFDLFGCSVFLSVPLVSRVYFRLRATTMRKYTRRTKHTVAVVELLEAEARECARTT